MGVNMEKLKGCFRALISFLGNVLTLRFPLWLCIVAISVAALLLMCIACNSRKDTKRITEYVYQFDYCGHSYIMFDSHGVIHDPECICYFLNEDEK